MALHDQTRKTASGDSGRAASRDSSKAASDDSSKAASGESAEIASRLLAWYDAHHRDLPWRIAPRELARGVRPDPYRIWLSEVMLQQTTVEAVKSYFRAFVQKWPDVEALAASPTEDVMKAWAGLGYYSRARNLKACADLVARQGGRFPDTQAALRELPGIGAYTAAAIAAIAFDQPAAVVDGNVERVVSRLFSIATPLSEAKADIRAYVERMVPATRPGDFAQAMMDLGATICTPRRPRCMLCPLRDDCSATVSGDPEHFPVRLPKAEKPLRRGAAFVAVRADGAILLRKRVEKGLLGGMTEVPTTGWTARIDGATTDAAAPFPGDWRPAGRIGHVFTHFGLELDVFKSVAEGAAPAGHFWSLAHEISGEALPTVMKKVIEAAIPGATKKQRPH
ncbi:A/G-specific adenine glycosylase [Mesorhizobium sp. M6A.T.Ce.TU.002.03.1.1]|uniref:A/G-specific adenine glycosylase n=1 Tax=Mesorhizobium sp. M6A.T.Ce.TU.002.03.1.1 TaxID=2496782 RepID=UPI000FCBEA9F|nr:A/G-specific adenine glycosylase [Mesorhizobium sp. M6A.T.Ce.TU.002.03.1.1]RUU33706.1 A/G-specific adenine glycosylase [Mesorhizobium sp. M6A.T.Ce.TU.002.03.1.1]RWQ75069.1 MAG: A/G-specific adenine glycosylase [Mesorhizobium sp.]